MSSLLSIFSLVLVISFLRKSNSGSGSLADQGTQSTACSCFHACGRTGGKSPCSLRHMSYFGL
jgi:hypothetical protein